MTIDDYIADFPGPVQVLLEKVRKTIRKAVPDGEEAIRYRIPTFRLNNRNLIHFAAFESHIGVYPAPRNVPELEEEMKPYWNGKGTLRFPLDKPIPLPLIAKVAKYWVNSRG
ncbi:MAG TPA: DUF1801 domain-containing protein [Thermoanaerobaculia bacterium]|jgi:uncharacterized protein YdhG (YjbR/CyaY superfamily)|nr:DUF1801 domain-containing protein [Thermoanaerobaculia bacterium]